MIRLLARAAPCALLLLAASGPAFAALGAGADSVERDRAALRGTRAISLHAGWEAHELAAPDGARVREYLASGGRVFAVTWTGPRAPDLRQLLGASFERYTAEARARRTGHHVLAIDTPDFAASAVRFQRGFQGRAILPALVPSGVARADLR